MIVSLCLLLVLGATPPLPLSISATDDALAVFANPAGMGATGGQELCWIYNFRRVPWSQFATNNTFVLDLGGLGAFWEPSPSKYGLALGVGDRRVRAGIRFVHDSTSSWDAGTLVRPARWLSLGLVWSGITRGWGRLDAGAAVRPFGERVTLFAETRLASPITGVYGFEAEPLDGLTLSCRLVPGEDLRSTNFSAGINFGIGAASVGAAATRFPSEVAGLLSFRSRHGRTIVPDPRRYLEVKLAEPITDQKPGFTLFSARSGRSSWQLVRMIRQATDDDRLRALVLEIDGAEMSFAQAQELRLELERFRSRGKRLYVFSPDLGMNGYYLASTADRIISHPLGSVSIPGTSAQVIMLKGTLDKLGIEFSYTRHGKYKSAVETFSRDSLSGPNREQWQALVDDAYEEFVRTVAPARRMSRETLEARIGHGFYTAEQARAAGLIDTLCYRDQLDSLLRADLAGLRRVSESRYRDALASQVDRSWQEKPAVAIIYASGSIVRGESGNDLLTGSLSMGSSTMVRAIRSARDNPRVKAIVLRIDSPGGDGFASDLIWRELEIARKKKPLIASMGSVAGSGGYYIACNARRVFALPSTLTGSIGVFDARFVTEGLYNKLGARREVLKRGERADALGDVRAPTAAEDSIWQDMVDEFYSQFVHKVASGRGLSEAKVDSIGQGRVWSGSAGRTVGIVDSLGGLLQAVGYAKGEAKLADCDYLFYPRPRADFLSLLGGFARDQVLTVRYE